jgi:hypothetical protein
VPELRKPCTSDSPGTYAGGGCPRPTAPRQQAGGSTPPPPQAEAATQESHRPTIGRPGGGGRRLLIGLGVLGAVIVVGLIVAIT